MDHALLWLVQSTSCHIIPPILFISSAVSAFTHLHLVHQPASPKCHIDMTCQRGHKDPGVQIIRSHMTSLAYVCLMLKVDLLIDTHFKTLETLWEIYLAQDLQVRSVDSSCLTSHNLVFDVFLRICESCIALIDSLHGFSADSFYRFLINLILWQHAKSALNHENRD